jgi:Icc-related predicted phosphoesterase
MKLVLISDTHGKHRDFEIPDGDVLVFAGDMMTDGWHWPEIMSFNNWLGELPHPHKIVTAGNHDRLFETNPSYARGLLTNATYLENSGCEIGGLKFWGSPYMPAFCDWAFNSTPEQLKKHWSLIPEDTDVLITHGPPWGTNDKAHPSHDHLGDKELTKAVARLVPRLHVYGHIHGGHGRSGGLICPSVNASLVDEAYQPVNKPIVVEL